MTHSRLAQAESIKPFIINLRRTIHKKPELGFDVNTTAGVVASALQEMGVEVQTGVGKTGVVGYLGDGDGPTIAIRADMDALPILEDTGLDFSSEVAGKMHACGHDAHTAMLLGAAKLLADSPIKGQIRFLFQPSEECADSEGISGAPRMIADGAMKGVDRVIALHVDGETEVGKIMIGPGKVSAAVDSFYADVIGTGGHGARPQASIDPIWLATHVMNALYAVPSRRIDPFEPNVLSLGVVRGGMASNVIPRSVYIEGTLRSMDSGVRVQLRDRGGAMLWHCAGAGWRLQIALRAGLPIDEQRRGCVKLIADTAKDVLGAVGLAEPKRMMGAEDFSYMSEAAPGAMFMLGVRKPGGAPQYVHTPTFTIDEDALPIGSALLAENALRLLEVARK